MLLTVFRWLSHDLFDDGTESHLWLTTCHYKSVIITIMNDFRLPKQIILRILNSSSTLFNITNNNNK